jgi:hypothetical protein
MNKDQYGRTGRAHLIIKIEIENVMTIQTRHSLADRCPTVRRQSDVNNYSAELSKPGLSQDLIQLRPIERIKGVDFTV